MSERPNPDHPERVYYTELSDRQLVDEARKAVAHSTVGKESARQSWRFAWLDMRAELRHRKLIQQIDDQAAQLRAELDAVRPATVPGYAR